MYETARLPGPVRMTDPADLAEIQVRDLAARPWSGLGRYLDDPDSRDAVAHDNTRRAGQAVAALVGYCDRTGAAGHVEAQTALGDLLADVAHLCDALGIDFTDLVARVSETYLDPEIHGQP